MADPLTLEPDVTTTRERLAPVIPRELVSDITGVREPQAGFIPLVKKAALPVAGGVIGGVTGTMLGGPALGMALGAGGAAAGEIASQQMGLSPEDPMQALLAAAPLPMGGLGRQGLLRLPGATGGQQQSLMLREIGTELGKRGAVVAAPLLPPVASKTLYRQFEQALQGQPVLFDPAAFRASAGAFVTELEDFGIRAPKPLRDFLESPPGTLLSLDAFNTIRETIGHRLGALRKHPASGAMSQLYARAWDELDTLGTTGQAATGVLPVQAMAPLKAAVAANKRERAASLLMSLTDKKIVTREGMEQVDVNAIVGTLSKNETVQRLQKLGVGAEEVDEIRKTLMAWSHLPLTQQTTMIGFSTGMPFAQRQLIAGALGASVGAVSGGGLGAAVGAPTAVLAVEGLSSLLMSRGGRWFIQFMAEHPMAIDQFSGIFLQMARVRLFADMPPVSERIADLPSGPVRLQERPGAFMSPGAVDLPSLREGVSLLPMLPQPQ